MCGVFVVVFFGVRAVFRQIGVHVFFVVESERQGGVKDRLRGVKEEELRASLHLEDIEVDWHLRVDIGKRGGRGRRVTNEMM